MSQVVHTPHKVLIQNALPVKNINGGIKSVIAGMKQALLSADNPKGVGLAAPQIGESLRIFLIRPDEKTKIQVFINPEYVSKNPQMYENLPGKSHQLEGCLSIPRVWGVVKRHQSLKLKYTDETGKTHSKEFTGFPAVIIQHEMDHLDGILFPRRVLEQKGKLFRPVKDEKGKEVLEEIEI